mgnify:CR=1 FL=1
MDPSQRLTCEQLLNHPYFDRYDIYSDKNRQRGQRDQRVRTSSHCAPRITLTVFETILHAVFLYFFLP